jgi:MFS family permease
MASREAAEAARQETSGLPRVVWVLAGGSFINNLGSFVVPFLVLYLLRDGYGAGLAAGAVSAYAAGKMAAGPAGGMLTDRLGPRAVTAGSMAASAAATLALAAVHGPALIVATAALTGLVSQLYRPATSAILAAAVPAPRRVRAFGVYQLGVSGGTAAGPAIGGLVAEHSFLVLFTADAATSLCWAILAWRALAGIRSGAATVPPCSSAPRRRVLGDRWLARLLVVTVLVNLVLFQAQTTLPLWVHSQGLPTSTYGLLLALNSALVMALQLPAGRLTGRWRPEPVIAAACLIIAAGFTLLVFAHTALLLAAAVTVWSLGELAQWPVAAAYTADLAPAGMTSRYAGARSFCYGLALLVAPLTGTTLYNLDPPVLWAACGAVGICAAAISISRRNAAPPISPAPRGPAAEHRRPSRSLARPPTSRASPSRGLVPQPSGPPPLFCSRQLPVIGGLPCQCPALPCSLTSARPASTSGWPISAAPSSRSSSTLRSPAGSSRYSTTMARTAAAHRFMSTAATTRRSCCWTGR